MGNSQPWLWLHWWVLTMCLFYAAGQKNTIWHPSNPRNLIDLHGFTWFFSILYKSDKLDQFYHVQVWCWPVHRLFSWIKFKLMTLRSTWSTWSTSTLPVPAAGGIGQGNMFEIVRKEGWTSVILRPVKWEQPPQMPLPSARPWPSLGVAVLRQGGKIMEIPWQKTSWRILIVMI